MWRRGLVAAVAVATVASWSPAAASDRADRLTGEDPAHAAAQVGDTAASAVVPLPDLGISHRLPPGGMNLWRMPLSELEAGVGLPQLVKTLDFGGFSYDDSRTVAGDFGDITASDDGTADHLIWHRQPNGGVLVWAVGGGSDTTPRLWHDLRTGGWSYADSQPLVGDVTGDGWDDLVVVHRNGAHGSNLWVFPNNGFVLSAPQLWGTYQVGLSRPFLADASGDGVVDLVTVSEALNRSSRRLEFTYSAYYNSRSSFSIGYHSLFQGASAAGWSVSASRQSAGDVDGDGLTDIVTAHAQQNGGILVWVHRGCGFMCLQPPQIWQDLRTGGWSFAGSRQHLADTDGDGRHDLVSLHSQSGHPGILVWRHRSTGSGLSTPQIVADLRTGGWSYAASRAGVANTWGVLAE